MEKSDLLSVLRIIDRTASAYGKNEVGIPGIDSRVLARYPAIVLEGRLGACLQALEEQAFIMRVASFAYGITEEGKALLKAEDQQAS